MESSHVELSTLHTRLQQQQGLLKCITWLASLSLLLPTAPLYAAALVVDGAAAQAHQASLGVAANGVPLIDIVKANGQGLSHNKFTDFNVGQAGLILNNSTADTQTLLGGAIRGNQNLNGAAASLILNEVTSNNRSVLQGYQEVAGQAADVIVANPNGISCNGCGFINTPQATLTTGVAQFNSGSLSGFQVRGGDIAIGALGLDVTDAQRFNLVTRSLTVDGALYANDLAVFTGSSDYDYLNRSATAVAASGTAPSYLVDTSALGGIYAKRIMLLGNEVGVGVRIRGDMAASTDDLIINNNGVIELNNAAQLVAKRDIYIASNGHAFTAQDGYVYAQQDLNLAVADSQSIDFDYYADGSITLAANSWLQTNGTIDAGNNLIASLLGDAHFDNSNVLTSGIFSVSAQNLWLDNNTSIAADGDIVVSNTQKIMVNNSQLAGKATMELSADSLEVSGIGIAANKGVKSQQDMTLNVTKITGNGDLVSGAALTVNAPAANFSNDATLNSTGDMQINVSVLENSGKLLSGGRLASTASTVRNNVQAVMAANNGALLGDGSGSLNNKVGAVITSENNSAVTLNFNSIDNVGTVNASGELHIVTGDLNNSGVVYTSVLLDIQADSLTNRAGAYIGGDGTAPGRLLGTAGNTLTNDGMINYGGDLFVSGYQQVVNAASQLIAATGDILFSVIDIDNYGQLHSDKALTLDSTGKDMFKVRGGSKITAKDAINLYADNVTVERNAELYSEGDILISKNLAKDNLDALFNEGNILALNDIEINTTYTTNYNGSEIFSGNNLRLGEGSSGRLKNNGLLAAVNSLSVRHDTLENQSLGKIQAQHVYLNDGHSSVYLDGQVRRLINSGDVYSVGNMTIPLMVDNYGTIQAGDISAGFSATSGSVLSFVNHAQGKITSSSAYWDGNDNGSSSFINRGLVYMSAGARFRLDGARLENIGELYSGTGSMTIDALRLENSGTISMFGNGSPNSLKIAGELINSGSIFATTDLNITVGEAYQYNGGQGQTTGNGLFNMAGASIVANNNLSIISEGVSVFNGCLTVLSCENHSYSAADVLVGGSATMQAGNDLIVDMYPWNYKDLQSTHTSGDFINFSSSKLLAGANLNLRGVNGSDFINYQNAKISAVGDIVLDGSHKSYVWSPHSLYGFNFYNHGSLIAGNAIESLPRSLAPGVSGRNIPLDMFVNGLTGSVLAGSMDINVGLSFLNKGTVWALNDLGIHAYNENNSRPGMFIQNEKHIESALGNISLGGVVYTDSKSWMAIEFINASAGTIYAAGDIDISTGGFIGYNKQRPLTIRNEAGGIIAASNKLEMLAKSLTNAGTLQATTADIRASDNLCNGCISNPVTQSSTSNSRDTTVTNASGNASQPININADATSAGSIGSTAGINAPANTLIPGVNILFPQPGSGGLFVQSSPGSSYLIETRSEFGLDYLSSQWLLDLIAEQNQTNGDEERPAAEAAARSGEVIRLGDGYYETMMVRDQIAALTQQRFIYEGVTDDALQYQMLMSNAADSYLALELVPGVELSVEQISNLSQDIVWLVEVEVDGVKALAPKVYLTEATLASMAKGGKILADDINIATQGLMENSGTIAGGKSVKISSASDVINRGNVTGGDINIDAERRMTNRGVVEGEHVIARGGEIGENFGTLRGRKYVELGGERIVNRAGSTIASEDGEVGFVGGSLEKEEGYTLKTSRINLGLKSDWDNDGEYNGFKSIRGYVGKLTNSNRTLQADSIDLKATNIDNAGGKILATNKLALESDNNIDNTGGAIKSSAGDVSLKAQNNIINRGADIEGGNVDLKTVNGDIINSASETKRSGNKGNYTDVQGKRGSINARNDLSMAAGGNLVNAASDISAGGNASLTAGEDIIFSAENLQKKTTTKRTSGFLLNKKTTTTTTTTNTVVGSTLKVGGRLDLESGGDATFTAADVEVGGDANVDVGGDLKFLAGQNSTLTDTYSEESGLGVGGGLGGKETIDDEHFVGTNAGSTFKVGGNSTIKSGGKVVLQGSEVEIKGHSALDAGGDIEMLDGLDEEWRKKTTTTTTYLKTDNDSDSDAGAASEAEAGGRTAAASGAAESEAGATGNLKFSEKTVTVFESGKKTSVASQFTVGGNSTISSGGKLTVQGSNITVGGDSAIAAQDVEVKAGRNEDWEKSDTTRTSVGFYSEATAEAGAEGEVQARAEGPLGVNATAEGEASADASATLTLGARVENEGYYTKTVTHSGAGITAGGNMTIKAANKASFVGANVESGGDMDIEASDIESSAVQDTYEKTDYKNSHTAGLYVGAGASADANSQTRAEAAGTQDAHAQAEAGVNAEAGLRYKFEGESSEEGSTTHVGSSFKAGGDFTRKATNKISDQATSIEAGGDINQTAKVITELAAEDTTYSNSYTEEHEVRLGAVAGAGGEVEAEAGLSHEKKDGAVDQSVEGDKGVGAGYSLTYEGSREDTEESTSTAAVTRYKAGGNINSKSTGKTTLLATQMEAGGDITLEAKSLEIKSVEENSKNSSYKNEGSAEITVTTKGGAKGKGMSAEYGHEGESENIYTAATASIKAGGNLKIKTQGNTTLEGTDLEAGNKADIDAGGSVNLNAASERSDSTEREIGASADYGAELSGDNAKGLRAEYSQANTDTTGHKTVTIKSGAGGTSIKANANVVIEGAQFNSEGATAIEAGGTVELKAVENTELTTDFGVELGLDPEKSEGVSETKARAGGHFQRSDSTVSQVTTVNSKGGVTIKGATIIDQESVLKSDTSSVQLQGAVENKEAINDESNIDVEIHSGNRVLSK